MICTRAKVARALFELSFHLGSERQLSAILIPDKPLCSARKSSPGVFRSQSCFPSLPTETRGVMYLSTGAACSGSLIPGKHHLGEPDEGVSLWGRPELTDLSDGFLTVALSQVVGLLHAIALTHNKGRC